MTRTGYTPGETIRFSALVNNQSPRTIKASYVRLKQNVSYKWVFQNKYWFDISLLNQYFRAKTFSGTEHTKSTSRLIEKKEKGEVAPHSEVKWANETMVIPSLTPRLSKCSIIEISYVLEFEVFFTFFAFNDVNFIKSFRLIQVWQFSCLLLLALFLVYPTL